MSDTLRRFVSIKTWVSAVEEQLHRSESVPQFMHSWREVAREYETIYCEIFETDLK